MICFRTYNEEDVPSPANAVLVVESDGSGLTNHGVEGKVRHGRNGNTLGSGLGVEDLGRDDP